ncbi:MAG: SRPBCC family protein [Nannocystis sp.]|nr:SRPBCC family protein [Nannocystis sp.]MBA3549504.1 SRPBCC family protein [Nannocystis sp.]
MDTQTEQREEFPWPDDINVHPIERMFSAGLGLSFMLMALLRRGIVGAGLGGLGVALIHRGMTGHCSVYSALKVSTAHGVRGPSASVPHGQGIRIRHTVTIRRTPEELYQFWRRLDNLPRFMRHVESVIVLDDLHSRWRVDGPAETSVVWDAEIINDVENELIAWRSLPGSQIPNAGSVRFHPALGEGTLVTVTLEYDPPAGLIGAAIAKLLGADPQAQIAEDLHRLKVMFEGGEIPQIGAQWRGRLSEIPDLETARELLQTEEKTEGEGVNNN